MTSGGHNRKITAGQRAELLSVYLADGQAAAADLAKVYGVGPDYARKLASASGIRPRYVATGTLRTMEASI